MFFPFMSIIVRFSSTHENVLVKLVHALLTSEKCEKWVIIDFTNVFIRFHVKTIFSEVYHITRSVKYICLIQKNIIKAMGNECQEHSWHSFICKKIFSRLWKCIMISKMTLNYKKYSNYILVIFALIPTDIKKFPYSLIFGIRIVRNQYICVFLYLCKKTYLKGQESYAYKNKVFSRT